MKEQLTMGDEPISYEAFLYRCEAKSVYGVTTHSGEDEDYCGFPDRALEALLASGDWEATMSMRYSGHLHRGSPYETDNSCGNCDGANCADEDDVCNPIYSVTVTRMKTVTRGCEKWTAQSGAWGPCRETGCRMCHGTGTYESREQA